MSIQVLIGTAAMLVGIAQVCIANQLPTDETSRVGSSSVGLRTVVGKLVWPEGVDGLPFTHRVFWLKEQPDAANAWLLEQVESVSPPGFNTWGDEEKTAFLNSEAGKKFIKQLGAFSEQAAARIRTYVPQVSHDGSFVISGVLPGKYMLLVEVFDTASDVGSDAESRLEVDGRKHVPLLEIPEKKQDSRAQVDLGSIVVEPIRASVTVGDRALPFTVPYVDFDAAANSQDVLAKDLVEFIPGDGRVTVLCFWSTGCFPSATEQASLKDVWDEYRDKANFRLIGLSVDRDPRAVAAFARKHGYLWTQGFLGPWWESELPYDYGIGGTPAIWVIDGSGTIVGRHLIDGEIRESVDSALMGVRIHD